MSNTIISGYDTGDNITPLSDRYCVQSMKEEPFSFHCRLPNGAFLSDDTYFLNPDPSVTITSPGNGTHQLTATAYNQFNNSVLGDASRGYTRNGMIKPDIAAPGFQLPCAVP